MNSIISSIKHTTWKGSLFWRYFALLAIVVVVFLIALTTSTNLSFRLLQDSYFQQTRETFYQNCKSISQDISTVYQLASSIETSEYYREVYYAKKPFTSQKQYYFAKMRDFFSDQCDLQNFFQNGFVFFKRSGIYITPNRVLETGGIDQYYIYKDEPAISDIIASLEQGKELTIIPVQPVSVNGMNASPYMTVLIKPITSNLTFGFYCSDTRILEAFDIASLPDQTYLKLVSLQGDPLFIYNEPVNASRDSIEFTFYIQTLGCNATIGIPQTYFMDMLKDSQEIAAYTFLISLFLGLMLCIFFSYIGVKPFHSLIQEHALPKEDQTNEVKAIDNYIRYAKQNNEELRHMLLSSIFVRAFYSLPIHDAEYANLAFDHPRFHSAMQIALVKTQASVIAESEQVHLFDDLLRLLPGETIYENISLTEICVLLEPESLSYDKFQKILMEANYSLSDIPRFLAGVSRAFCDLHDLPTAMRQAQLSMPEDGARITAVFSESMEEASCSEDAELVLAQLKQELTCWNEKEVLHILQGYSRQAASNSLSQPEELFYNITHLLKNAAKNNNFSLIQYENIGYQHSITTSANFCILEDIAKYLFRQKNKLQLSEIQKLSQDLVQYMNDHFADPALSPATLSQEFCVSERFAGKAILSVTGNHFSKYLLSIRMQEAGRLLRETNHSNITISELCGYPAISTFYRNFKNYYNKTPAEYKDSFSDVKCQK